MADSEAILEIEPPELRFPCGAEKQISRTLYLSNRTDVHVAFEVKSTDPRNYIVRPNKGILLPRAICDVVVTMKVLMEAPPGMKFRHKFQVQSVIVDQCDVSKKFTRGLFSEESGLTVHKQKLYVIYSNPPKLQSLIREELDEGTSPQASVSDNGHSITSIFGNESKITSQHDKESSEVVGDGGFDIVYRGTPAAAAMTDSDAILEIQPPVLKFPFESKKRISCSLHLSNLSDVHVAFKINTTNPSNYAVKPNSGILLPRATCDVVVMMQALKVAPPEMKCKDRFQVQSVQVDSAIADQFYGLVSPEMFLKESGFTVHEEKLHVIYSEPRPPSKLREALDEEPSRKESKVTSQHENNSAERTASQDDSTQDKESQRVYIGLASIFSYEELQEATKSFNSSEVVGEGGFGIVYRGMLRDGRTVAIKDLNVRHPKRIEQFFNEVSVLFRARHQNLVSLYGCTSPEIRKLLLVYEFVPNGTVAYHLRGGQVSKVSLPWDTRIRIAVETADAISYLHSLEPPIIHRDIKTDNILLDDNLTVKVADLGNCRLLPCGARHVSTMPQGTHGYLDPEYNLCLKLTDKSDVYSFGVVLLELISGKKALDLDRDDDEIWLSRMALNKMKNKAMEQLADPELGYCSDVKVMSMVNSVTELALRCLKPKGNMRPPMVEVLMTLKKIRDGKKMGHDDVSSFTLALSDDSLSASNSPSEHDLS